VGFKYALLLLLPSRAQELRFIKNGIAFNPGFRGPRRSICGAHQRAPSSRVAAAVEPFRAIRYLSLSFCHACVRLFSVMQDTTCSGKPVVVAPFQLPVTRSGRRPCCILKSTVGPHASLRHCLVILSHGSPMRIHECDDNDTPQPLPFRSPEARCVSVGNFKLLLLNSSAGTLFVQPCPHSVPGVASQKPPSCLLRFIPVNPRISTNASSGGGGSSLPASHPPRWYPARDM